MMVQRGFSLFEAVIVIVITGILAAIVAIFIFSPVQGFFTTAARIELVDASDNTMRSMSRELRRSLPNSVRVRADSLAIEFVPTVAGARYRTEIATAGDDPLLFSQADTSFDVFGSPLNVAVGNWAVVYNLGDAVVGSNVYAASTTAAEQLTSNRRQITAVTPTKWTIASTAPLPDVAYTPPFRAFAVESPVAYICDLTAGTLKRMSGYGFSTAFPAATLGASTLLASGVTSCVFTYDANAVAQRSGLVLLRITMQIATPKGPDTATLTHHVHVDNLP